MRAFLVTQSLEGLRVQGLDDFKTHEVTPAVLEERTLLGFDPSLHHAAGRGQGVAAAARSHRLVASVESVRW